MFDFNPADLLRLLLFPSATLGWGADVLHVRLNGERFSMIVPDDRRLFEWSEASRRAQRRSSSMQDSLGRGAIDEGTQRQLDRFSWLSALIDSLKQNAEIAGNFSPQTHPATVELYRSTIDATKAVAVVLPVDGQHYRVRLLDDVAKRLSLSPAVIVDREALDSILLFIGTL